MQGAQRARSATSIRWSVGLEPVGAGQAREMVFEQNRVARRPGRVRRDRSASSGSEGAFISLLARLRAEDDDDGDTPTTTRS